MWDQEGLSEGAAFEQGPERRKEPAVQMLGRSSEAKAVGAGTPHREDIWRRAGGQRGWS